MEYKQFTPLTPPKVNCEVMVKPEFGWEERWVDIKTGMVYAYHKGQLWPQWHQDKYYKFRHVISLEDLQQCKEHKND